MSVAKAQGMDAKQAVSMARRYFDDFFGSEPIKNILLEQLDFDDAAGVWHVTFGFDAGRETFQPGALSGIVPAQRTPIREARTFKIEDATGALVKMTDA